MPGCILDGDGKKSAGQDGESKELRDKASHGTITMTLIYVALFIMGVILWFLRHLEFEQRETNLTISC